MTYHHCQHPKYTDEGFESGEFTPWGTLRGFWETCNDYQQQNMKKYTVRIEVGSQIIEVSNIKAANKSEAASIAARIVRNNNGVQVGGVEI